MLLILRSLKEELALVRADARIRLDSLVQKVQTITRRAQKASADLQEERQKNREYEVKLVRSTRLLDDSNQIVKQMIARQKLNGGLQKKSSAPSPGREPASPKNEAPSRDCPTPRTPLGTLAAPNIDAPTAVTAVLKPGISKRERKAPTLYKTEPAPPPTETRKQVETQVKQNEREAAETAAPNTDASPNMDPSPRNLKTLALAASACASRYDNFLGDAKSAMPTRTFQKKLEKPAGGNLGVGRGKAAERCSSQMEQTLTISMSPILERSGDELGFSSDSTSTPTLNVPSDRTSDRIKGHAPQAANDDGLNTLYAIMSSSAMRERIDGATAALPGAAARFVARRRGPKVKTPTSSETLATPNGKVQHGKVQHVRFAATPDRKTPSDCLISDRLISERKTSQASSHDGMTTRRGITTPSMTPRRGITTPSMTPRRGITTPSMTPRREITTRSMTPRREITTPSETSKTLPLSLTRSRRAPRPGLVYH